ncbi:TIM-barrel domain-containing protein [Enterococcus sp. DIV0187]|uniref:glycoside hydrolase family 31 protein n=1 Tax=Enterococcus sp. DIV0187 TaxID=2774644 RepID=UPI003F28B9D6
MNVVQGADYRFTIITNKLCRLEYSKTGKFEDRPTQFVQNRDLGEVDYTVKENNGGHLIEIETDSFHLYYDGGKFTASNLYIDAKYNYGTYFSRWHFGEKDKNNLLGTTETLDGIDGAVPLETGIQSKDGFSYIDDTDSFVLLEDEFISRNQQAVDGYYFAYGRDYRQALKDYYRLSGKTPLIPRYALGNWWSRYYKYTQESYLQLMDRFEKEDIPISVSVIDMDWHKTDIPVRFGSAWTGYSWNKDLFPEPEKLLKELHERGKHVTLNVHPAAGIRAFEDSYPAVAERMKLDQNAEEPAIFNFDNPIFRESYFKDVHHPIEDQGVDFWWVDWQQGTSRDKSKIEPLWALNHYHFLDNSKRNHNDGLLLSRYAGPGSHRYPLGFSGDSIITWDSLAFQPYFTATATNIGYTWWSHDIGGHYKGSYDAELSLRWLQFGVFSPINRLHSYDNPFVGKEPWNFPVQIERSMSDFMRLRGKLIPYLDTANYHTSVSGRALIEPMYYQYPDEREAYNFPNQYLFGSEMFVAPITTPTIADIDMSTEDVWLPEGVWYDFFSDLRYQGGTKIKVCRDINSIPVFVKAGGIVPLSGDYMEDPETLPNKIVVHVFPGENNRYSMFEHVGEDIAETIFEYDEKNRQLTYTVNDPKKIVPLDREIEIIIHNAEANQNVLVEGEIIKRLQNTRMSYDTKKEIFRFLPTAFSDSRKFSSYIETLENSAIRAMLTEMCYLIE